MNDISQTNIRHIRYVFSCWQDVDHFVVAESDRPFTTCQLEIVFCNRRRLMLYYGSLASVWDVINQPLFFGHYVYWFGRGYEIKPENGDTLKPQVV
jgi:hypothetical protein